LVVLLTVALLTQGPVGAFEAFRDFTVDLLGTLVGGEELCLEVLCQCTPLAAAIATVTFSYRARWLALNPRSLLAVGTLVVAATWGGGELRGWIAKNKRSVGSEVAVLPASTRGATRVLFSDQRAFDTAPKSISYRADTRPDDSLNVETEPPQAEVLSVSQALAPIADLRSSATVSDHRWSRPVPRVALLPELESDVGRIALGINQLVGFVIVYRPRLFLAAVLLGFYLGWSWQPYFDYVSSRWLGNAETPLPNG
jgi:hypothetical protein